MIRPAENNCSGCRSCEQSCPTKCIVMEPNENGFLVPKVDITKCVDCGICERKCPVLSSVRTYAAKHVFAAYAQLEECSHSSSGGIFYVLAKTHLENGGIVFGAAYDKSMRLKIRAANSIESLRGVQGSKYSQANTDNSFEIVKECLKKGERVLFSGTPCQIAGLKSFLGKVNQSWLLTVEIICHGTPSPKMFEDYIRWIEQDRKKKVQEYYFRTKKAKDKDFRCLITFIDGSEEILSGFRDPFYKKFMSGDCYREICYKCPFAKKERIADFTIGDFWNSEDINGKITQTKERISVVLVNTDIGEQYWNQVAPILVKQEVAWDIAAKGNANLYKPSGCPSGYKGYGAVKHYNEYFESIRREKGSFAKELFNMLPTGIRRKLKKYIFKRGA